MSLLFKTGCPEGYDFVHTIFNLGNMLFVWDYLEDIYDAVGGTEKFTIDHINEYMKTCYAEKTDLMTFDAAQADCNSDNGYLTEPKSWQYLSVLENAIDENEDNSETSFWIGIKKVEGV